jgi:hypothetical protein
MEMEARGLADPTRKELGNKVGVVFMVLGMRTETSSDCLHVQVKLYKGTLDTVQQDLKRAKEKFSRAALMGGANTPGGRPLDFDKSL